MFTADTRKELAELEGIAVLGGILSELEDGDWIRTAAPGKDADHHA